MMKKGFTLIELLVVMAIVLLVMGLALPRLKGFGSNARLSSQARRIAGAAKYTYEQAVRTGRPHQLNYNLEEQYYWITYQDQEGVVKEAEDILAKKRVMIKGVRLRDVLKPEAKIEQGVTYTEFSPKGFAERTIIHLESNNSIVSILINPLTAESEVLDGYVQMQG